MSNICASITEDQDQLANPVGTVSIHPSSVSRFSEAPATDDKSQVLATASALLFVQDLGWSLVIVDFFIGSRLWLASMPLTLVVNG